MPRATRCFPAEMVFHVLNRSVGRRTLFQSERDYAALEQVLEETLRTRAMRICAYCVMPNHWHLILWPQHDTHLSAFMQHFTNTHVKRWKAYRQEVGHGHLYQGRFKAFPVQGDDHFYQVVRYVERNPLRAKLVTRAEAWPWSSLSRTQQQDATPAWLFPWPVPRPAEWSNWVNHPENDDELTALRHALVRGTPYGNEAWASSTAIRLGLQSTLRPRGRPKKQ